MPEFNHLQITVNNNYVCEAKTLFGDTVCRDPISLKLTQLSIVDFIVWTLKPRNKDF